MSAAISGQSPSTGKLQYVYVIPGGFAGRADSDSATVELVHRRAAGSGSLGGWPGESWFDRRFRTVALTPAEARRLATKLNDAAALVEEETP